MPYRLNNYITMILTNCGSGYETVPLPMHAYLNCVEVWSDAAGCNCFFDGIESLDGTELLDWKNHTPLLVSGLSCHMWSGTQLVWQTIHECPDYSWCYLPTFHSYYQCPPPLPPSLSCMWLHLSTPNHFILQAIWKCSYQSTLHRALINAQLSRCY